MRDIPAIGEERHAAIQRKWAGGWRFVGAIHPIGIIAKEGNEAVKNTDSPYKTGGENHLHIPNEGGALSREKDTAGSSTDGAQIEQQALFEKNQESAAVCGAEATHRSRAESCLG